MLEEYHFTSEEKKELLSSIVVLIDSREKKNYHITNYLNERGIKYTLYPLQFGDYSCIIPKNDKFGIVRDIYFNKHIAIERKASLEELSNNFTQGRERFSNEFLRGNSAKLYLIVEGASYNDIFNDCYKTKIKPYAFLSSLLAFQEKYNLNVNFINKEFAGAFIYSQLYYFVRSKLN